MFGLFRKKAVIDNSSRNWLLDTYEWAIRNCGSDTFLEDVVLVLPSNDFFPEKVKDKSHLVRYIFETMKKYAGLEDWPIDIIEKEANPNPRVAETLVISGAPYDPPMDVRFPDSENEDILIAYSQDITNNIERLVSGFAYDLTRIFCSYIQEEPPGGTEFYGHNTELTAVFLGFGLILANSAHQFQQYTDVGSQGWSSSTVGYLSQYELTYALAIFCELKNIESDVIEKHLKKSLLPYFKRARQELSADSKILWRLNNINSPIKDKF